jgi:two-component system sensor histidine kinase SenX3
MNGMEPSTGAVLYALAGVLLGGGVVLAWRVSDRQMTTMPAGPEPVVPAGVAAVLRVLESSALVVDEDDTVLQASAPAYALGLIGENQVCVPELVELVHAVRRDGEIRHSDLVVPRPRDVPAWIVSARVAPLGNRLVLVLVEDRTRERQVEAIRRDFVANVSHELKTPVGAIGVLAEAVHEASGDPAAVERFAQRMQIESTRLTRLVQQIIELSRVQGDNPLQEPAPTDLDTVVARVVEQSATDADNKRVAVKHVGQPGLQVMAEPEQAVVAVGNLLANAVTYAPQGTTILISTQRAGAMVDLTVTDSGIGIPSEQIDRIFERFYRVDPARHRSTGGTGLGLSIVKHVAACYGGQVRVSSTPGQGSAFTLSLPGVASHLAAPPGRLSRT